MNETLKILESRRSCRKFIVDKMPSEEDLKAIARAGTFAPSGHGSQSGKIIVVTNKDLRDKISAENAKIMGQQPGFDPFYGAPVIMIVLVDKNAPTYKYDGPLVMANLMTAAESLGISSIWIHRAKEEFDSDFGKQILKELGLEGEYEGVGHLALGYAADGAIRPAAPRKENVFWCR